MKYLFWLSGASQFITGVVDLYMDYDKFTFIWLITGLLFIILGCYFSLEDQIKELKK